MRYSGIITAAGLSSRMGAFKPLLEINGLPMICHTVLSMESAGISPICVVTGYRGEEIRRVLENYDVIFAENAAPESSDMLTSVKRGIEKIYDSDAFLLLPGDMPLVSKEVFKAVKNADGSYIIPRFNGKNVHPPRISKAYFDKILRFSGDGGLSAALSDAPKTYVDIHDENACLDADYRNEFENIRKIGAKTLGIGDEKCMEIFKEAETPAHVIAHCMAVAALSEEIARSLIKNGVYLDILLCRSGAMLHDVLRLHKFHDHAGADYIALLGYTAVSEIIRAHLTGDYMDFTEKSVVFLADKLVSETKRVSVDARYAPALEKFPAETDIGIRVRRDIQSAKRLIDLHKSITGENL